MDSPDGPQDRRKEPELADEYDGEVDENYKAISEILKSLEGNDKSENETSAVPKQNPVGGEFASGNTKTFRRERHRRPE